MRDIYDGKVVQDHIERCTLPQGPQKHHVGVGHRPFPDVQGRRKDQCLPIPDSELQRLASPSLQARCGVPHGCYWKG